MKRIFAIAIMFILILSCVTSSAESFMLRNGITFGDTMEDVLEKETFEIDTIDEENDNEEATDPDAEPVEYPYSITTVENTLAGIPESYIYYKFDANKTLKEVDYHFRSSSYKDTIDNDYDKVNEGLIRKYGTPLGYTNGDCYIFTGSAIEGAAIIAYLFEMLDGYGDLRDYDEWDVEYDDYHVKIEQVEYYYGSSYSEIDYCHRMSYTYFTDEDLNAEMDSKKDSQNAVDSDI